MKQEPPAKAGRRRSRVLPWLICLVLTLVLMEGVARVFWKLEYNVPLFHSDKILYAFYPELKDAYWRDPDLGPGDPVEILLLGGSVLHRDWGNVERELREQLTYALKRPVRIYNMAEIGQTSRDSFLKYKALADKSFDLVIFYHGINEARANNVPPDLFKTDYSHYTWYEAVNRLQRYHNDSVFALPYTLEFFATRLKERLTSDDYVSMDRPRRAWLAYGEDIKSAAAFEANLRGVMEMAEDRGEPLLVMTFATFLPEDYAPDLFEAKRLDYGLHLSPVEIWGRPANVVKAVRSHNEVVKALAPQYDGARLVDQAALIPQGHRHFNDICHLTGRGSTVFVDNILPVIVETLERQDNAAKF